MYWHHDELLFYHRSHTTAIAWFFGFWYHDECLGHASFLLKIFKAFQMRSFFTWLAIVSMPSLAWSLATLRPSMESKLLQITFISWVGSGLAGWATWNDFSLLRAGLGVDCGLGYLAGSSVSTSWVQIYGTSLMFPKNSYASPVTHIFSCWLYPLVYDGQLVSSKLMGVRLGYCLTIFCSTLLFSY